MSTIGIIGGSGVYDLPGLREVREVRVRTPFGDPSDPYRVGRLGDATVVFLARHGRGHRFLPSELNARANIWGMKKLGVERLISFSAVGSLRDELVPGHVVLPAQAIGRTPGRPGTFFGDGLVAHVAFADPTCAGLRAVLADAARDAHAPAVHEGGTLVVMEGPAFSTRAESHLHRAFGASLIGMTMLPEAKLAREAELCYATVALVTDYDCWHEVHGDVTAHAVLEVMKANTEVARRTAAAAVERLAHLPRTCACGQALAGALFTAPDAIPPATRKRLALLVDRYLPAPAPKTVKRRAAGHTRKAPGPRAAAAPARRARKGS
jgi:5'-methylthioadenosine phosphorylase